MSDNRFFKKLWIDQYEGESSTSREIIEESACALFNISQRVIETLISEEFLIVNDDDDLLAIIEYYSFDNKCGIVGFAIHLLDNNQNNIIGKIRGVNKVVE